MVATKRIDQDFILWDDVTEFTPDLYERYINAPRHELDSSASIQLYSDDEYQTYWYALTKQLMSDSRKNIGAWQEYASRAQEGLEKLEEGQVGMTDLEEAIAAQPIPFAAAQIDERVAALATNPAIPTVVPMQEQQIPYCTAINMFMEGELEANNYESAVYGLHYDDQFFNCSILKETVNHFERGMYGQMGRIYIEQVDPTTVFWDPLAKKLDWRQMDYLVQLHEMEIGEIKRQYPFAAKKIDSTMTNMLNASQSDPRESTNYIQSPQPQLAKERTNSRQKIHVAELWIKDSREVFKPFPNDEPGASYMERFKTDADGYLLGEWVPRYPDGRLIVTAGGRVLKDIPNPCAHGEAPFVFFQAAPRKKPNTIGIAPKIMVLTRKMNNIMYNVHAYLQSEIQRPMHRDVGAIWSADQSEEVPQKATDIIDLQQGKKFDRRPPQDIPPSTMPYLQSLQGALDLTSGSSAIMRGEMKEGAQLSAEAIQSLDKQSSKRLALELKQFNVSVKRLGYHLMWLIRQTYDANIELPVKMPDGQVIKYSWKSDRKIFEKGDPNEIAKLRATEDYAVSIKAGTGTPGGAPSMPPLIEMFKANLLDREATLDGYQVAGRQFINQRMRQKELEDIKAKAEGKAAGIPIGEEIRKMKPDAREKG